MHHTLLPIAISAACLLSACGGGSLTSPVSTESSNANTEVPHASDNDTNTEPVPFFDGVNANDWIYVPERSDEFDGTSIDPSKWQNDINDWGPWSWEPSNTTQTHGHLSITMRHQPHQRMINGAMRELFYTSGIYRSTTAQTYGYFEARIKGTPTFPGNSPAFWLYSNRADREAAGMTPLQNGDPHYSEVDIVELQQREWSDITGTQGWDDERVIDMNLHAVYQDSSKANGTDEVRPHNHNSHLSQNKLRANFDPRADFHIYAAMVTPEKITWYLDGKAVFSKDNHYWTLPMRVTLSLGLRNPLVTYQCSGAYAGLSRCPVPSQTNETDYPTAMVVDWVRVYEPRVL